MQLNPGGLREMHWHANAGEWAYVIDGRCRVTTIDPDNHAEVVDFGPGEIWYFPRGHGHSIEGIGDKPCLFILVFDNGYFSEFGTFSISDWVAHTPPTCSRRISACRPRPSPPSRRARSTSPSAPIPRRSPPPGSVNTGPLTHRYDMHAQAPETFAGGEMRIVSEREFPISATVTGALLTIKPGGMRELHWHPNAAEWQYYLKGTGRMTVFGSGGRARTDAFAAGDVGYVPQGYGHYIENTGTEDLVVLLALNNGTYRSISITAWFAGTPVETLATNFGVPASTFAAFPKGEERMP